MSKAKKDTELEQDAAQEATPCACVEVVKAFAALPLEQRLAVHKAIDQAVAIDKERAGLGQDSNTELYDQAIAALNQ
jgi:hypothetical protein